MTSRNLFFKLMKENLKRRSWNILLSMLAFFIFLTVLLALKVNNIDTNYSTVADINKMVTDIMGSKYFLLCFVTITVALICGLSGFYYLHSKKMIDLYHSIPVRREIQFGVCYINGILIYLVPYIINILLCFVILQVNGLMGGNVFVASLRGIGINLLFYLLIYTLTIIAVMLTGNIIVSCLGTAVFLLYGPLVMEIKELYCTDFFTTYVQMSSVSNFEKFLSPIGHYIYVSCLSGKDGYGLSFISVIKYILFIGLLILLALFLYKKRPSEAAGKAMAFSVSKPIIKFMLVIPATMLGGILFRQTARNSITAWFVFGLIFAFIISNALIEIIFNFDIRSAFRHKRQMLYSGVVLAVIVCIFQFDLIKYDEYIPDENKVKYVGVSITGLDDNLSYFERQSDGITFRYTDRDSYQLEHMKITNLKAAYALAGIGIENAKKNVTLKNNYPYSYTKGITSDDFYTYTIKYSLKNGRKVYRKYYITTEESFELLEDLFMNEDYKKAHYSIYDLEAKDIAYLSCHNMLKDMEFSLSDEEKQEFLDIYKEELMGLNLEDMANEVPQATLQIWIRSTADSEIALDKKELCFSAFYYVYPEFVKTKEFLKAHGFNADRQVTAKDVTSVTVTNYQKMKLDSDLQTQNLSKTYEDKDKIEAILPHLIDMDYYYNNRTILNYVKDLSVELLLQKDDYGNDFNYQFYFKDTVPDFVKEDVKYQD